METSAPCRVPAPDEMHRKSANELFERLKSVEGLDEAAAKETVAGIVTLLQKANITYDCAFELLRLTERTLREMQARLAL
jgi:hypothetical protein